MNENIEGKEEKKLTPELELLLKELGLSRKNWWSLYNAMRNTGDAVKTQLPIMYALSLKRAIQTFNKGRKRLLGAWLFLRLSCLLLP